MILAGHRLPCRDNFSMQPQHMSDVSSGQFAGETDASLSTESRNGRIAAESELDTIARQIVDHAEVLYQDWMARGVAVSASSTCTTSSGAFDFRSRLNSSSLKRASSAKLSSFLRTETSSDNNRLAQKYNGAIGDQLFPVDCSHRYTDNESNLVCHHDKDGAVTVRSPSDIPPPNLMDLPTSFRAVNFRDDACVPRVRPVRFSPLNSTCTLDRSSSLPASQEQSAGLLTSNDFCDTHHFSSSCVSQEQLALELLASNDNNETLGRLVKSFIHHDKVLQRISSSSGSCSPDTVSETGNSDINCARNASCYLRPTPISLSADIDIAEEHATHTNLHDDKLLDDLLALQDTHRSDSVCDPHSADNCPPSCDPAQPLNSAICDKFGKQFDARLDVNATGLLSLSVTCTDSGFCSAVTQSVSALRTGSVSTISLASEPAIGPSHQVVKRLELPSTSLPDIVRGSVAERVYMLERCPRSNCVPTSNTSHSTCPVSRDLSYQSSVRTKNLPGESHSNIPFYKNKSYACNRPNASINIPRFYFPNGKPSQFKDKCNLQHQLIIQAFSDLNLRNSQDVIDLDQFSGVAKACECPLYWRAPLYSAACAGSTHALNQAKFLKFWRQFSSTYHDEAVRFVHILTGGERDYLLPQDFMSIIQDVVESHPGFGCFFPEFFRRYAQTVIARIYYYVNRSWSGRITVCEIRRSNLLQTIKNLELYDDINYNNSYFSYNHFYVIYCKFHELDGDHDLYINKDDFAAYNDYALSDRIIDRIFSGAVSRNSFCSGEPTTSCMSFTDFVWFIISEEDKRHPTSIEYWFRCMDLDGDGFISIYELKYFFESQEERIVYNNLQTVPSFDNIINWVLDMVQPELEDRISLRDLKRCRTPHIFFDTFFNLAKYYDRDTRDPFFGPRDEEYVEMLDWNIFAADAFEQIMEIEDRRVMQSLHQPGAQPEAGSVSAVAAVTSTPDHDYSDVHQILSDATPGHGLGAQAYPVQQLHY